MIVAFSGAKAQESKGDKVVVVDDESCGCELYFVNGIQTIERDGLFGFKLEDGTVIATTIIPYSKTIADEYYIEDDILDILVESLTEGESSYQTTEYEYEFLADLPFTACSTTINYDGYDAYFNYYVYEEDDEFIIVLIGSNSYSNLSNADYEEYFTAIE